MEKSTRIPRRNEGLLERDLGDAVVVMAETGELLHTVEGSALFIWKLIDGKNSTDDLLACLMGEYEVAPDRASADLEAFLQTLTDSSLVLID
jgi:hypothetical protein